MIHLAIEDPTPIEPQGLYPCTRCGEPTWYTLCDRCEKEKDALHHD